MFDERRFAAQLALRGITQAELAKQLNIDPSTLYRKVKAQGNFTRKEINQIIEILSIDNPAEIFFADELA
jgi:predicted transcriptional regulator